MNIETARQACTAFGADWRVKKEGSGSLICTKGGTSAGANCNSIDTWRVVVWLDGYGDPLGVYQGQYNTHAGYYYGGHKDCQSGPDSLGVGYSWGYDTGSGMK